MPKNIYFAGMMEYDGDLKLPTNHLVAPPAISDTVGERMATAEKHVLSLAETQKFGHVTFFFNGNKSGALPFEEQKEVSSANVPFNQLPEMSAEEVTDIACQAITSKKYHHIRLNLANGDMVGHTGDFKATVKALEVLDDCIEKLETSVRQTDSLLLITADHGNADEMYQFDKKKNAF